jgi:hypothetical protein
MKFSNKKVSRAKEDQTREFGVEQKDKKRKSEPVKQIV